MSLDVNLYYQLDDNSPREGVYSANITYNLNKMADAAGIYECVWCPDENNIRFAYQLIEPIKSGLQLMINNPTSYEKYNAPNGWGLYENFVPWLQRYLRACEEHPAAKVRVSR